VSVSPGARTAVNPAVQPYVPPSSVASLLTRTFSRSVALPNTWSESRTLGMSHQCAVVRPTQPSKAALCAAKAASNATRTSATKANMLWTPPSTKLSCLPAMRQTQGEGDFSRYKIFTAVFVGLLLALCGSDSSSTRRAEHFVKLDKIGKKIKGVHRGGVFAEIHDCIAQHTATVR
jgi:hypothetical protein